MDFVKGSAQLEEKFQHLNLGNANASDTLRKLGPLVPPKPHKNQSKAEIPQSCYIGQACKPLYSQRLQFADTESSSNENAISNDIIAANVTDVKQPLLQRRKPAFGSQNNFDNDTCKVTLDNPAILEQQLEVLAHHKMQLERKGLLPKHSANNNVPKLSTTSLASGSDVIYANMQSTEATTKHSEQASMEKLEGYSNVNNHRRYFENIQAAQKEAPKQGNLQNNVYSNLIYKKKYSDSMPSTASLSIVMPEVTTCSENDMPAPPSPVSSSYSELRRANDIFSVKKSDNNIHKPSSSNAFGGFNSINIKYKNDFGNQEHTDYYGVGSFSQASSTYESIYEPINPRPPSQLSSRSNFVNFSPYANSQNAQISNSSSLNLLSFGVDTGPNNLSFYSTGEGNGKDYSDPSLKSETEVENLTNFLVHSMDEVNDIDNYGICFKCNERVLGENSGCTAMNQIYHITCFTCAQCQINLQGKPFYSLEGKPYCECDYLQTLEKCSVCMKPILERILRATGKPYHPQCFMCIACGKSLDGVPFTVDATNQNYCIEDFHKKFAPRCCVCKEPIMPEPGEEETVRVVALDRSFHFECYKCEDCGLLLSSESEGRGCYPLDDHVLCKSCNAKRVQQLTNCITTEI